MADPGLTSSGTAACVVQELAVLLQIADFATVSSVTPDMLWRHFADATLATCPNDGCNGRLSNLEVHEGSEKGTVHQRGAVRQRVSSHIVNVTQPSVLTVEAVLRLSQVRRSQYCVRPRRRFPPCCLCPTAPRFSSGSTTTYCASPCSCRETTTRGLCRSISGRVCHGVLP
jgi:hypothetical protein